MLSVTSIINDGVTTGLANFVLAMHKKIGLYDLNMEPNNDPIPHLYLQMDFTLNSFHDTHISFGIIC